MRSSVILNLCALAIAYSPCSMAWQMQAVPIQTRWARMVSPDNALPEYPRPQLVRKNWQNLNGLWRYAITAQDAQRPLAFDDRILVPYPLESALSGVRRILQPDQILWYQRDLNAQPTRGGEKTLIHFGAVDYEATVYVNEREVGRHTGGYESFTIDVTDALRPGNNSLVVKVYDPTGANDTTSATPNPRGKQSLQPDGIMYSASSGIWQTVWLEHVPATYIETLRMTPNVDGRKLLLEVEVVGDARFELEAIARNGKAMVARQRTSDSTIALGIPDPHLWSPDDPFLYGLQVRLLRNGKTVDSVQSYFGMRKIEVKKDAAGIERIFLNDQPTYNLGTLDQGFWPEGIYTAPTDDALQFDVQVIKAMGFNTIRKHVKVEPDRWYYHCDRMGLLVWQDMVPPANDTAEARAQFEAEMKDILHQLHNHPSITTWVLFNEGWGAYDQQRLEGLIKSVDRSRLVNGHSGSTLVDSGITAYKENEQIVREGETRDMAVGFSGEKSDLTDLHTYPDPVFRPMIRTGKAQVLGEYGGVGVPIEGHVWDPTAANWGYIKITREAMTAKYAGMMDKLKAFEVQGLSGSIYTQPFDVEKEFNGLITYDREVMKIPLTEINRINSTLVPNAKNYLIIGQPRFAANEDHKVSVHH